MKKTLIIICMLNIVFSCKKKEEPQEPFYDDVVKVGWYLNLDRQGENIQVVRPDTNKVNLTIFANNTYTGFILRRFKGSVGYEVPFSTKVIRFREISENGKRGYVIEGDTFAGRKFILP
jgi:hypothetical protein